MPFSNYWFRLVINLTPKVPSFRLFVDHYKGAMIAIRLNQSLIEDMISNFDSFALIIVKITFGYFLYDLIDMLRTHGWNPM